LSKRDINNQVNLCAIMNNLSSSKVNCLSEI